MGLGAGSRRPLPATEERVVDSVPHPFFEASAEPFPAALLFLILVRRYFRNVKVQQKRCNPVLPKSYERIGSRFAGEWPRPGSARLRIRSAQMLRKLSMTP